MLERSDGRKGCLLCATCPNHRGNMGNVPPSIQSFYFIVREKRSNYAQSSPFPHHTLENLKTLRGSHPWSFTVLSPGTSHRCTDRVLTSDPEYSRCYERVRCTQGSIDQHIPGWCTPTMVHPAYTPGSTMLLMVPLFPYPGSTTRLMVPLSQYPGGMLGIVHRLSVPGRHAGYSTPSPTVPGRHAGYSTLLLPYPGGMLGVYIPFYRTREACWVPRP